MSAFCCALPANSNDALISSAAKDANAAIAPIGCRLTSVTCAAASDCVINPPEDLAGPIEFAGRRDDWISCLDN